MKSLIILCVTVILFLPGCTLNIQAEQEIFIRANQVGFLPGDIKSCVVLSSNNLEGENVEIINTKTNETGFETTIKNNNGSYGSFRYTYRIDFSQLKEDGEYVIEIGKNRSYTFTIGKKVYNDLAKTLLDFLKVQRCGYTNPYLHNVCHISDATAIIENGITSQNKIDVTGGWHDAGDYVKFLNTTAYATYMLLFAYEFDPHRFGFDTDKNNVADILEEAKVGVDWMLRVAYKKNKFVTQVQDLRDHEVGWRLPEEDPLTFDRPAFVGVGKNIIGIYTATMALASRIWKDVLNYPEYADQCRLTAENFYSVYNSVPDIDKSGNGLYTDKNYEGKLALGAVELYKLTNKKKYLTEAMVLADSAGSDYWWSWGDINSLAHYRLAHYDIKYADYIKNNLDVFNKKKDDNTFGKGAELSWGTNNVLLGITLQKILWDKLKNNNSYDSLAVYQRDYILGRNPWGISFIYNVGDNYTENFHHQISHLKKKLPGGFAAGPATKEFLKGYSIEYESPDKYSRFQTDDDYYRDDRMDYITNEPTITANATAIFVFGCLSN
ncbi:MAG: glycoside hydrolase family 9 protein [Bacteroidota bacterium]